MTRISKWAIFLIPLKSIVLMTNEALKLVQSKQDNVPIMPMYTINIFMDLSIYINNEIYYFYKKNITSVL
jgi:hypothetical protein